MQAIAPLLNRKQAAATLNVAVRNLDYLIAAGEIKIVKIGASVRIRPSALEEFIAARERSK